MMNIIEGWWFQMYIKKQLLLHRLTYDLMYKDHWDLIFVSANRNEYWLEHANKGRKDIVRLSLKQLDWRRDVYQDMLRAEQQYEQKQTRILAQPVDFHHIYISDFEPVDDWYDLTEQKTEVKRTRDSFVYMLDDEHRADELIKIQNKVNATAFESIQMPDNVIEMEQANAYIQHNIYQLYQQRQKQKEGLFQQAKPFFTYVLLGINVFIYFLLELNGGSTSISTLIAFGAKENMAIMNGEWWRIVTSMFLHIGMPHILLNMLALYFIGTLVERIYGNFRFLLIYFIAGMIGGLASFALNPSLAAGASGAIFGLFGALLFFGVTYPKVFFQTMGWNVIFVIGINVVFGFSVPQIDNGAHIGGMVGGFFSSMLVMFPTYRRKIIQSLGFVLVLCSTLGLTFYGLQNESVHYDESIITQRAQNYIEDERYKETIDVVTNGLAYADDFNAELLFFRSYAYLQLQKYQNARQDLEEAIKMKPNFEEALYNLALTYRQMGQTEEALQTIKKAIEINPEASEYQKLKETLQQTSGA